MRGVKDIPSVPRVFTLCHCPFIELVDSLHLFQIFKRCHLLTLSKTQRHIFPENQWVVPWFQRFRRHQRAPRDIQFMGNGLRFSESKTHGLNFL